MKNKYLGILARLLIVALPIALIYASCMLHLSVELWITAIMIIGVSSMMLLMLALSYDTIRHMKSNKEWKTMVWTVVCSVIGLSSGTWFTVNGYIVASPDLTGTIMRYYMTGVLGIIISGIIGVAIWVTPFVGIMLYELLKFITVWIIKGEK